MSQSMIQAYVHGADGGIVGTIAEEVVEDVIDSISVGTLAEKVIDVVAESIVLRCCSILW